MSKARIVMVSPLPELTRLAHQISRELNFRMEIVEAFLDKGVELGKQFERNGAEVIISRGPTGVLLKKELSVPVILIQITNFDIIQALNHAKKIGHKIAYFDHIRRKEIYDFDSIAQILALENLRLFFYHDEKELDEQIRQAREEGVDVIVASGICVIRMAKEHGMEGVMIFSSREAVIEAMKWAEDVVKIRQKDREKAEFLKTIIDHTHNGVIAVNKDGVVTHFNPAAEEVFNFPADDIVGKRVDDLPLPLLKNLFENPSAVKGEIHKVGERQIVFNHIPIHIDREPLGAVITFQSVHKLQNLEAAVRKKLHASGLVSRYTFKDIVGSSEEIRRAVDRARKFAQTDSTVLVTGESGTGKELFVHSIHAESLRREGPFVAINCANIPKELLESELFGYEEGAFTGAKKGGKIGLFELAHGGTIFLDEISELSLPLQSNLLRVLQEKAVRRIGGERIIPVNVRIIAATNRFLPDEIKRGNFREDLFFRLNVLNLHIPPLRNRKGDIPLLVEHFFRKYQGRSEGRIEKFPDSVIRFLCEYDWPGNVRELENFVEKYVILSDGSKDNFRLMEELVDELYRFKEDAKNLKREEGRYITINVGTLEYMERQIIEKLYHQNNLDKKQLAFLLGISRTTLWKKLKSLEKELKNSVQ